MISAQNLFLNVTTQADSPKDKQNGSQANALNFTADNLDLNKENNQQDNVLEPNTFISLLSQVFSDNLTGQTESTDQSSVTKNEDAKTDKADLGAEDLANLNPNALIPLMQTDMQTVQELELNTKAQSDTLAADAADSARALDQIKDNPAVSWIDSSSFQSMTATDQVNVASSDKKTPASVDESLSSTVLNSDGDTRLDRISLSDAQTKGLPNTLHDSNNVSNTNVADNKASEVTHPVSDKPKNDILQSLQQLSTGIGATVTTPTVKKTTTAIADVTNTVNTAQIPVTPNQANPLHATQTKALEIAVPVTDPQWSNKFSDHIVWLGQNEIKSAVIRIHPEELGPLQINIKVDKDSASVNIISHSPQVRDIVDQALPRLRDMLSEQGVNLSDVNVSADQRSNQFAQNSNGNEQQSGADFSAGDSDDDVHSVTSVRKRPKGLVDYFA